MKKLFFFLLAICITMMVQAQATYEVGKVYEINGVKGLVYKVSANGRHGMMISLKACPRKQSALVSDKKMFAVAMSLSENVENGMKNYKAVESYIQEHGLSWSVFPVYEWVRSLGEGWYIPSKQEQMEMLSCLYEGQEFVNNVLIGKDKVMKSVYKELRDNKADLWQYPMMSSTGTSVTNKKGKTTYFRYGLSLVPSQSSGGILGAIVQISVEATVDKIQMTSGYFLNTKFYGTRAIKSF